MEWNAHSTIIRNCEGFDNGKYEVIKQLQPLEKGPLSDKEWAVLRYCDAITMNVTVSQDLFDDVVKAGFNEQEIVEITLTCASYNMVSRFLLPLDVGELNDSAPDFLDKQYMRL